MRNMNNELALKLAAECELAVKTMIDKGFIVTVPRVYAAVLANKELVSMVDVTVATVSRSLRSLLKTRRVFMTVINNESRWSTTPFPRDASQVTCVITKADEGKGLWVEPGGTTVTLPAAEPKPANALRQLPPVEQSFDLSGQSRFVPGSVVPNGEETREIKDATQTPEGGDKLGA